MTNKSVAYMLVAVVVGYMLISAVPGQIEMFATPQRTFSMQSGETVTVEVEENTTDGPELYNYEANDSAIDFHDNITITGNGFVQSEDTDIEFELVEEPVEGIKDLNTEVEDLAEQLQEVSEEFDEIESDVADVAVIADDAVAAAEAASEAVSAVAATANTASEAAADAAETASAARNAASGLTTLYMATWWIIDIMIALGVYLMAKGRFG
jgi:methyl-accepting chemotaxis protein